VELALALGKEKSVLRAQQGARNGLRARALLKGLPPAPVTPYGYSWDKTKTRLQPTAEWENAKLIFDLALQGRPIRQICKELLRRAIRSSSGWAIWSPSSVYHKLTNPLYGGRYYALRTEAVTPRVRTRDTYGKSSVRDKDLSESVYLPNVVVESPVVSWEEWLAIQDRLADNKLKAQRNAKHDYLLRSFILCDTHHSHYGGHLGARGFYYRCRNAVSLNQTTCVRREINGLQIEAQAKAACRRVLENPEIIEREIGQRTGVAKDTEGSIRKGLAELERKATRNTNTETNLLLEKARGSASEESFTRAMAIVRTERRWITQERERLNKEMESLKQGEAAARGLLIMRERVAKKLNSDDNEVWRTIFNGLGMRIHITEKGDIEITVAIPVEEAAIVSKAPED